MKNFRLLLMLTLMVVGVQINTAQVDKGFLKMEITDVYSENEQMMAMSEMFKGSFTEVYFTPEKAYTLVNMMGGMSVTEVLVDKKTNQNVMLMNAMGQKMKIKLDETELKELQAGTQSAQVEYQHFNDETKEILGFKCHKVKLSGEGTQGADMTLWVTDEINSSAHVANGIQTEMLKGFPLEYVISVAGQLDLTMKATKFEKDFDQKVFNLSTDGYKEMTLDELMETMSSMGGGM